MKYIRKESVISTNLYAAELLGKGLISEATLIIAKEQTGGKGYGKNNWESKAGENLTISLILFPNFVEASEQFLISMAVSLAIAEVVEDAFKHASKFSPQNFYTKFADTISVKWPNDVYVGNKKIAGVLIENSVLGTQIESSIIGIGLNVNQAKFESDAPNPISLYQLTQNSHIKDFILKETVSKIEFYMALLKNNQKNLIRTNYISKLFRYNEIHFFKKGNEKFKAKIVGIDDFGYLLLEKANNKIEKFMFKEVEFV